jgi:hypothetical protein
VLPLLARLAVPRHPPQQLPSLHDARLVSLLGALMSAAYCIIAIVMSATVQRSAAVNYSPAAVQRSPIERVMGVFNAMTTVFFAYGGHNVALEIQATIPIGGKHPLSTVPAMMRGVNVTFIITGARARVCVLLVCRCAGGVLAAGGCGDVPAPAQPVCLHVSRMPSSRPLHKRSTFARAHTRRPVLLWRVHPGLLRVRHRRLGQRAAGV